MIELILFSISLTSSFAADAVKTTAAPRATIAPKNTVAQQAQASQRPVVPAKSARNALANKSTNLSNHTQARSVTAPSSSAAYLGGRTPASHDINEAIDITGQSRNLSMGLMFQRDKDKVSFGSPRTNYKDKITSQQTNY